MSSNSPSFTEQFSLRKKVAFYLQDTRTVIGLWFNLIILGLILVSSAIFVAETYEIPEQIRNNLEILDLIILVIFAIEYGLRFWSASNKRKFFFSFFSFIDLIAILPLLFGFLDIRFIRIFRWFRILRIVRFWRFEVKLFGIKAQDSIVFARIF